MLRLVLVVNNLFVILQRWPKDCVRGDKGATPKHRQLLSQEFNSELSYGSMIKVKSVSFESVIPTRKCSFEIHLKELCQVFSFVILDLDRRSKDVWGGDGQVKGIKMTLPTRCQLFLSVLDLTLMLTLHCLIIRWSLDPFCCCWYCLLQALAKLQDFRTTFQPKFDRIKGNSMICRPPCKTHKLSLAESDLHGGEVSKR